MVVAEFTGLGGEAEVRDGGDGNVGFGGGQREAVGPLVLRLVLQVESQRLVLEVSQTRLGGDGGAPKTAGLELVSGME